MKTCRLLLMLTLLLPARVTAQSPASADSAWKRGDMVSAERMYSFILKQDSSDAVALYRYALTQAWKQRYAESLHLFDRLLAIDPEDAYVRVGRARVLAWSGRRGAATASLDSVLAAHPRDVEARELRLTIARWSMRTTVAPSFVYESDSEHNRVDNVRSGVIYSLSEPLEVRADVYLRHVMSGPVDHLNGYGAAAGFWHRSSSGWTTLAQGGFSATDYASAETPEGYPNVRAYVVSPKRHSSQASVAYTLSALDLTMLLIRKRVSTSELSGVLNLGADTSTSGTLALSTTGYHSRASRLSNRRNAVSATVLRQWAASFRAGIAAHAFGFSKDLTDGYFDPDFYGNLELLARFEQSSRRLAFNGEVAPGLQQVNQGGATSGTIRGTGRLTYTFAVGRSVEAFAVYAQSGMNQVTQQTSTRYRYHAFGISANWIF